MSPYFLSFVYISPSLFLFSSFRVSRAACFLSLILPSISKLGCVAIPHWVQLSRRCRCDTFFPLSLPPPPFFRLFFFSRWVITCLRLQTFHTVWRCWCFFFFFFPSFFHPRRRERKTEWGAQEGVWTENKWRDFISTRSRHVGLIAWEPDCAPIAGPETRRRPFTPASADKWREANVRNRFSISRSRENFLLE